MASSGSVQCCTKSHFFWLQFFLFLNYKHRWGVHQVCRETENGQRSLSHSRLVGGRAGGGNLLACASCLTRYILIYGVKARKIRRQSSRRIWLCCFNCYCWQSWMFAFASGNQRGRSHWMNCKCVNVSLLRLAGPRTIAAALGQVLELMIMVVVAVIVIKLKSYCFAFYLLFLLFLCLLAREMMVLTRHSPTTWLTLHHHHHPHQKTRVDKRWW